MRIIVQKFGGTSVASPEVRELALRKIEKVREQGFSPVVVVSAMGRQGAPYATDTLIGIARSAYKGIAARELDQIMYCGEMISAVVMAGTLQAAGMDAIMLTGGHAGIITDANYTDARIVKCDPTRLIHLLRQGKVPVVCGFQGMTGDNEFTTLGRGGSDTSAAALGAALNAELVEIYTDVDGIMTADPRIVENAKILDCISYGEVCQLAHQGAKVIHPRAVEIAMQKNIPLVVKSTFSEAPGTLITNIAKEDTDGTAVIDRVATGVTYLNNIVQIKVHLDDAMGTDASFKVFKTMADSGISVDLINVHPGQIMFTINADHAEKASIRLKRLGYEIEVLENCAKVSVVGGGMREVPGVMASFIEALSRNRIAILQTVDSHTSISVLVPQSDVETAVKSLHEKFGLSN
ncbi:aspartate kinase [Sporomusa acidovorans]|uniref:Aspartokinase n=1 Tax=Sporomusa acidovorans (strain ATCC 49682 / DSM 3132 / Mol) TaxID=1123286 RepID=A0ABZ3J3I3_SPOA4|nr:aspartate kinase [Sporomusa acidovorans]OZC20128.1 aspartokinase [Sporomusa acidovorans DSM 3132]SDD44300.1 aspartate kinase [Sporomusa acidovorans]